jgi:subtilisin family serine protease
MSCLPLRWSLLRPLLIAGAVLFLSLAGVGAQTPPAAPLVQFEAPHAPDRIIVKYRGAGVAWVGSPGFVSEQVRSELRHSVNSVVTHRFAGDSNLEVLRLQGATTVADAIAELRGRPEVEYAEPDYEVSLSVHPNDPEYTAGSLWNLDNTGQVGPPEEYGLTGIVDADIDAPEGWDIRNDASPIIVAVIDTGIRRTHEDLAGNMWENAGEIAGNGIDDDGNGYIDDRYGLNAITYTDATTPAGDPADDNGHGTHCAGTIGAVGDNGVGVVGVAWHVRLMACKFLGADGYGYVSDAIECIDYARLNGAKVLSNSWSGGGYSEALLDAVRRARDEDIIFVAAAGNNSANIDSALVYPASLGLANVIAVAALDRTDQLAYYSNFGSSVLLGAPGSFINSTDSAGDQAYKYLSGTSMAAPHVAGALALLKAHYPGDSSNRLINRLAQSVRPVPAVAEKVLSKGMLNLHGALTTTNVAPLHDLRAAARAIRSSGQGSNFSVSGNNEGATKETGEANHGGNPGGHSVWYRFSVAQSGTVILTATGEGGFRPAMSIYVVGAGGILTPAGGAASGNQDVTVTLAAQSGRVYSVAIDGYDGDEGSFVLNGRQPPANDDFVHATNLSGGSGRITQIANGGSLESGELQTGAGSVWYQWTAPASGSYTLYVWGENMSDSCKIDVLTGDSLDTLASIPVESRQSVGTSYSNRPGISASQQLVFDAVAGTTYRWRASVSTPGLGMGLLRIAWASTPVNDAFNSAILLSGGEGTYSGDSEGATPGFLGGDFRPPHQVYGNGTKDVWFKWTAPAQGLVVFDTLADTAWDTTLEIFTGTAETSLLLVSANDDSDILPQSLVAWATDPGTEYLIKLNGYTVSVVAPGTDTPAGPYTLSWYFEADSPPDDFPVLSATAGDFDGDGYADTLWRNATTGDISSWPSLGGYKSFGREDSGWTFIDLGDFDDDGKVDTLWRNATNGTIASWPSAGGYLVFGVEGSGWAYVDLGDFDGDGKVDTLWRNSITGDISSWPSGGGYKSFGLEGDGWAFIDLGDFDGDGKVDTLWRNANTGDIASWPSLGGYLTFGREGGGWVYFDKDDFDGDGKVDTLWRNSITGDIASWPSLGGYKSFGREGDGWSYLAKADFDGDGKVDTLWRDANTGNIVTWPSAGPYKIFGREGDGWAYLRTGDFDGDGQADTLWHNAITGEIATWPSTGGFKSFGCEGSGWSYLSGPN